MKDLKTLLEGSILADVEDTLNVSGAEALCKTIEKGLLSDNANKQKKAVEELKTLVKEANCKELNSAKEVEPMKVYAQFDYKASWGTTYDFILFWTDDDIMRGSFIENYGKPIQVLSGPMSFTGHMINPKVAQLYNLTNSKYKDLFNELNANIFIKLFKKK
jgi:hypothetical protein